MLRLEKVTGDNVWDILKLEVAEEQKSFVADNTVSMVDAYIATTQNGQVFPFGLYDNDLLVGFLMIGFNAECEEDSPEITKNNYNLWRLMIDKKYQHKGYGKEAIVLALDFIRTFPCGKAEYCWLSYEPENHIAQKLYHSFGFEETGDMDAGEWIAVLRLL